MNMHVMCVRSAGLRGRGHMCPAAQQDGLSLSFPLPDPPLTFIALKPLVP